GNSIIVRTSGYADFSGEITPGGNGKLIAVYSIFGNDRQLMLRSPADVNMENDRCDAATISIGSLKDAFKSGATTAPSGVVEGIVISDRNSQNINGQNVVIQNGSEGILLRFTGSHSFLKGDRIAVDVSGGTLEEFRGLLQVNSIEPNKGSVLDQG